MQVKTILKSLLLSYSLTGVCLLLLSYLLFQFDLEKKYLALGITVTYVFSCLAGGVFAGKMLKIKRYLWGMLAGFCYFLLLLLVSYFAAGKWDLTLNHTITIFCMCLGGGTLGGMLS